MRSMNDLMRSIRIDGHKSHVEYQTVKDDGANIHEPGGGESLHW